MAHSGSTGFKDTPDGHLLVKIEIDMLVIWQKPLDLVFVP